MDKGKEIINEPFWMHPNSEKEIIGNNKMSGIYIKGISMPNGGTLKIEIGYDADKHPMALTENHDVFDVVPVPEHGRLGDLDELKTKIKKEDSGYELNSFGDGMWTAFRSVYQCIDTTPTIIPADKER